VIPLIFLALLLGAGLAAYEFSPRAHAWVDEHVRALHEAIAAHRAADAHLGTAHATIDAHQAMQQAGARDPWAQTAPSPAPASAPAPTPAPPPPASDMLALLTSALGSLYEAARANAAAAAATITAAKEAKTPEQRAGAAESAAAVDARARRIADALAHLGVGQCDVHTYEGVTPVKVRALIAKLHTAGMAVTGDDPWDIDTHEHGVKLRAVWDLASFKLNLIVTTKDAGVPCFLIWSRIDAAVREALGA
jgi:hypothetical protein